MRTPLAKAMDLYNLVTGKIKYDHNNKTVTLGRMYRRDGSYYDPAPYPIDDDEIEKIKQCIELAGGTDYMSPVTTREDAIARKIPVYISPDPCKYGHVGLKTITGKCYFCRESSDSPRQQAIRAGQKWYMPTDPCSKCGQVALRRVQDGQCANCKPPIKTVNDSPRQQAIRAGEKWYMPTDPCPHCNKTALRRVHDSRCSGCHPQKSRVERSNSPRQQAMRSGQKWYMPTDPCLHCGKTVLRRVNDSRCSGCYPTIRANRDSPRQQAIRAGQKWYMPIDPCLWCGKHSPKRVQDSLCSSCVDSKSIQWIIENQDMIITREMARTLGIDVYQEDATGWKWVSTGNCVSCIK